MMSNKIFVTQPFLPSLDEFIPYMEKIWENKILTNSGPFHQQLETELCNYLGVKYISLFTNGTQALITALQALNIMGEVITTPFSFVATANSLIWKGIKPVFVDIDQNTLNLDPTKLEAAITPQTTAIMPVHCYGRPCDVDSIQRIAEIYNLKVIYDAAHAFGVKCHCGSVLNHGDLSILSFHATKVFTTFEGGAIVCKDELMKNHIDNLKNFGIVNELNVVAPGMNGKMNEISAAFGLLQLKHIDAAMERRKKIDLDYRTGLRCINGITCIFNEAEINKNNSYFPVLVNNDYPISRDELYDKLKEKNIYTRRYFYPLISEYNIYKNFESSNSNNLPTATEKSKQILCLPIYPNLLDQDVKRIISEIIRLSK